MHILDVISYEGSNDVLVYRSPKTDFTNYSRLVVRESQIAYVYLDGKMTGPYTPGDYVMDTGNIPLLEKIVKIPFGGEAPFKAEVYFVNSAIAMNRPWGTRNQARVLDQTYGMMLDIGANGTIGLRISDPYRVMHAIVGTEGQLTADQCMDYFRENIGMKAKEFIAQVMARPDMNFMLFDQRLSEFSEELKQRICHDFESVGIEIYSFVLAHVQIPEDQFASIRLAYAQIAETKINTTVQTAAIQEEGKIADAQKDAAIASEGRRVETETARLNAEDIISEKEDSVRAEQEKRQRARDAAAQEAARQEALKDAQLDAQKTYLQWDVESQIKMAEAQQGVDLERLTQEQERLRAKTEIWKRKLQDEAEAQRTVIQGRAQGAARAAQGYTWQDEQNADVSRISAEHPQNQPPFSQFFGGQTYVNPQPFPGGAGVNKQTNPGFAFDSAQNMGTNDGFGMAGAAGYASDIGPAQTAPAGSGLSGKPSLKERLAQLKDLKDLDLITEEEFQKRKAEILSEI